MTVKQLSIVFSFSLSIYKDAASVLHTHTQSDVVFDLLYLQIFGN